MTAPDLTALTSAVDFSTVGNAILAAGALGIGMILALVAVRYVRDVVDDNRASDEAADEADAPRRADGEW